jgi:hypothetical protein
MMCLGLAKSHLEIKHERYLFGSLQLDFSKGALGSDELER